MAQGLDTMEGIKHFWHGHSTWKIVALYLLVIVVANVTVAIWGPGVSVLNAFLLVGFSLTSRDLLHDTWSNENLKRNMFLLVVAGTVLSILLGAGRIAIASGLAFAASETVDAVMYHVLGKRSRAVRVNGSNVVASGVDSILFPLLAFGWPPLVMIIVGQFAAKVVGGYLWSRALFRGKPA